MELSLECRGTRAMRGIWRSLGEGVLYGWGEQVWRGLARLSRCVSVLCSLLFSLAHSLLPFKPFLVRVFRDARANTGDPLRYHAHFVATVQTSPSALLCPMEVGAHARLGPGTTNARILMGCH